MKGTGIQIWLKSRLHRAASLAAAAAVVLIWNPTAQSGTPAMGWWGLLYPKFCMAAEENENAADDAENEAKNASEETAGASGEPENAADGTKNFVKIKPAFWLAEELAKLLD